MLYKILRIINIILWQVSFVSRKSVALQIEIYLTGELRQLKNKFLFSDKNNNIESDWQEIKKAVDMLYTLAYLCDSERDLIQKYIVKPEKHLWGEIDNDMYTIMKNTPDSYKETTVWKEICEDLRKKFFGINPEIFT